MFEFLIVTGTLFFAFACRSFAHPALRKFGAVAVLAASFLAGYFIGGESLVWGFAAVAVWFLLPWLDLLTRIRALRLPLDKKLRSRFPPSADIFPHLRPFTHEVETAGFKHVRDCGWEWDGMDQFVRFFYEEGSMSQATINLNRQHHLAVAYLSLSSRTKDGKVLTTSNYPFGAPMKPNPDQVLNQARTARTFYDLIAAHRDFLIRRGVKDRDIEPADPEELEGLAEREMRDQVNHNLDRGLIKLSGDGTFRYSWRGLLYLWFQSVKDMVRLS